MKRKKMFVAVIATKNLSARNTEVFSSSRNDGDWSSIVGADYQAVIQQALRLVDRWGSDKYEVLVGEIGARLERPMQYREVPL